MSDVRGTVARLYERNNGVEVEEGMTYAEFWMGTRESGPSYVVEDGGADRELLSLKDCILQSPEIRSLLGDKVFEKWDPNLPFLFKVLLVRKTLSIQAHPDKELAKNLHKAQPKLYKEANHKPEMVLALIFAKYASRLFLLLTEIYGYGQLDPSTVRLNLVFSTVVSYAIHFCPGINSYGSLTVFSEY